MARIHESVDIDAQPERVWAVVAEDVKNAPKWTTNLDKVEKLDAGPPGKKTRYRYHLDIGGQKVKLEVEQDVWNRPRKCAGRFIKGPLDGTWSYTYTRRKDGTTRLVYEMDYQLGGLLRFATGVLGPQYAAGISKNMENLKKYIESGKGPKPAKT
ncbi:MAG TPA: SRPBCC family protein [Candidatus Dormibacteraeota bacterium]|nr:SRPBCC family protein [Candidatus Dormibacteraeota bacterium]